MQSFAALFSEHLVFGVTASLALILIAIAVLIFLYQRLFGRRLHLSGNARARQPRLGVVDAFDLDRQRQLILVRRDNVEHLIMIGGPNDLVIEAAIVLAQPTVAIPGARDKDPGIPPLAPIAPPLLAPNPADVPANLPMGGAPPLPPDVAAPIPQAARQERPAPTPARPAAEGVPPRSLATPMTRPAGTPLRQPASPGAEPTAGPATTPARPLTQPYRSATPGAPLTPRSPATSPRPATFTPLQRGTSAASLRRDPPPAAAPAPEPAAAPTVGPEPRIDNAPSAPPIPSPNAVGGDEAAAGVAPAVQAEPTVSQPSAPVAAAPQTFDTLESLEEEMAKLLGRSADKPPG